ncbi:hypothetical protein MHU86_2946 [Fragilaria crotonensis]|nr:hypothetical protein MHU86_2946 [Fragilaria crotonensis]
MDAAEDLDKAAVVALGESMMPEKTISANLETDSGIDPTAQGEVENVCIPAVKVVEVVALIDDEGREGKTEESLDCDEEAVFDSEEVHPAKAERLERTKREPAQHICATLDLQQVHSDNPNAKIDVATMARSRRFNRT